MVSGRSLEAGTALLTAAFGVAVVVSSLDNGIGWSAAGVDAGTFPFVVGLIIVSGSLFNLAQGWLHAREIVLRSSELKRLAMLFIPAAIYVGVIPLIGIYRLGIYVLARWPGTSAVPSFLGIAAIGTAVALYLIFEVTFQISVPRGWLGSALGF